MCRSSANLREGTASHVYNPGTLCLLLGRPATNHTRKVVRYFAVRDLVRVVSTRFFFFALLTHQFVSFARNREGRAKLADVTNLTHFPTLTNTSRLDRTWSTPRDESDQTDPTLGSHLPVHVRCPRYFIIFLKV